MDRMAAASAKPTLLVLSQVYVPDPASVGQHMADAAQSMAARGYDVRVLTSGRGYDDPSVKYPKKEILNGVSVQRLPLSSFGKKSIAVRLLGGCIFMMQALIHGLFMRRIDGILVSTSPPMCSIAAVMLSVLRRAPITYWVMDLNPDQMIEMGNITERSLPARIFNALNRMILKRSRRVVVLDRFMLERVNRKHDVTDKAVILPPWPHEDQLDPVDRDTNPFRLKHDLGDSFVFMYSGNHSPANPIDTIVYAAERLAHRDDIKFLFVGGGLAKKSVEAAIERGAKNIISLPYQPFSELRFSLSAADVHLVTLGNEVVGVVHPCKVYGAMAVSRPVLFVGPKPSHVADILENDSIGWHLDHGDVDGAVRTIDSIVATSREELSAMGSRSKDLIEGRLGKESLCGRFCDVIEDAMSKKPMPVPAASQAEKAS